MTRQPLWVILCHLPQKERKEIVEEMKERDREEGGTGMKVKKQIVCVEVLRPSQPNGVMSSAVSLPNHTFTGQA